MKKGVLLIMAKTPRIGAVKTRLARDIGVLKAWQFYRTSLARTVRRLHGAGNWETWIQLTPDRDLRPARRWPPSTGLLTQGPGGIGERMQRGLTAVPHGVPAVLIGSDIPGVTPAHIRRAFDALKHSDAVFGPARDGGYWLVGFANRRSIRTPFKDVRWSSKHALYDTIANFAHRRIALVDALQDVDDGDAYKLLTQ
jgi:rSAM/selenodomain-associated transferase 1